MTERLLCRDKVRKLLRALLQEQEPERFAAIVNREAFPPIMPLYYLLGERLSEMYYATLNELMRELFPQHAEQGALAEAFWKLFGEIAADPNSYRIRERLKNRLDEFVHEWKKSLKLFEVAYLIDNLSLGTDSFSFVRVHFLTMDEVQLAQWRISRDNNHWTRTYDKFLGQPVVTIQVEAADTKRAFETGLREVLFSLDLIRVAGVRSLISRLNDEMFLWKLNGDYIVRQVNPPHPYPSWGWIRTFRPLIVEMGERIRKGLEPEYNNLLAIVNRELPEEITSHLQRAIRWISNSVLRERLDDKVVDLCTALEVMLLPSYEEGWKGQMIDLRHRLMGGNWNPGGILELYELRSKIIHGSAINVARYLDYWYLLHMCFEAMQLIVKRAKRAPEIQTLRDLIDTFETQEKLEDFIHLFQIGVFKGKRAKKVLKAAKNRLNELQRS